MMAGFEEQGGVNVEYTEIVEDDLPGLARIMKRAFDDEAQRFLGRQNYGPDGYDNGDFFRTWLFPYEQSKGYKIVKEGRLIGAYIVWIMPEGKNILGTIFVDPAWQGQGVGTATWQHIEASYPEAKNWTLETPSWSTRNHHFYEAKCGFSKIAEKELEDHPGTSFVFRKTIRSD